MFFSVPKGFPLDGNLSGKKCTALHFHFCSRSLEPIISLNLLFVLGAWSDGDSKWKSVDHDTKKEMGLHYMYVSIYLYILCILHVYFVSPMCNREYKFFQPKVRW